MQNALAASMQNNLPNQIGTQISQLGAPMMGQMSNPLNGAMSPINAQMNGIYLMKIPIEKMFDQNLL